MPTAFIAFLMVFQSTLPARGATSHRAVRAGLGIQFQSTLPARGATSGRRSCRHQGAISIHAPRTGSDSAPAFAPDAAEHFNPRSPHGERPEDDIEDSRLWVFQSTLPARGATRLLTFWTTSGQISIHAPRTGSDAELAFVAQLGKISIHAPRTGSDLVVRLLLRHRRLFQSTLPARGATKLVAVFARDREDFNPRSPHGERRLARATRKRDNIISIHAPRTGSDEALFAIARAITRISIHAPRTGSDLLSAGLPGLI